MKQKIQILEVDIDNHSNVYSIKDELDRQYQHITGIAVLGNVSDKILITNSSIDGIELFPKDFEALFLQSNSSVSPNDRFFNIVKREAKGNNIELSFKDLNNNSFSPYKLSIYLKLENRED